MPLKQSRERKSRLASFLSSAQRVDLSEQMAAHVLGCLRSCRRIEHVHVLAPAPVHGVQWIQDHGRGLNRELEAARAAFEEGPLLVIHADLPLLTTADVDALLDAADGRCALASDRHGQGTNALALSRGQPLSFQFGPGSFAAHRRAAGGMERTVSRAGLLCDIDTLDDLHQARIAGFRMPDSIEILLHGIGQAAPASLGDVGRGAQGPAHSPVAAARIGR